MRRLLFASVIALSPAAAASGVACHQSAPAVLDEGDASDAAEDADSSDAATADDGAYRPGTCLPQHFSLPACTWDAAAYAGCSLPVRAFIACENGTLEQHCDNCDGVATNQYSYTGCCTAPCRLDEIYVSCPGHGTRDLPAGCHPDGPPSPGGGEEMCCPCQ